MGLLDNIDFWNETYEKLEAYESGYSMNNEYLDTKLKEIAKCDNVLDFGCGDGWASMIIAKLGAKTVVGIDAAEYAIRIAKASAKLSNITNIIFICGTEKTLIENDENRFDACFSSNTLDVVDEEISDNIISAIASVLNRGAKFTIMLNAYMTNEIIEKMNMEEIKPRHFTKNNVLRCVNRTTTEWITRLSPYFLCEEDGTFHLDGEPDWYQRRLLVLVKK